MLWMDNDEQSSKKRQNLVGTAFVDKYLSVVSRMPQYWKNSRPYIDIVEENKSVTNAVSTVVFFEFLSKECSGYGL